MASEIERVARLAHEARQERVQAVYLLGMGGSSFHTTREQLSITNMVNSARFLEALLMLPA